MILLVRHGEAAAKWGDHPDPGLSKLGGRQAEAAAQAIKALGANKAVTSPMQRCKETAKPFERLIYTHSRIEPAVSEIVTPEGIADRPTWLRGVMGGTWAEAGQDLRDWQASMLDTVTAMPDKTVVFSHFVAINALVSAITKDPRVMVFQPGHCSVTMLARDGKELKIAQLGSEAATEVL